MAMGIVSDSDFESESTKLNVNLDKAPPIKPFKGKIHKPELVPCIDVPKKGRGEGNVEVPNSLRNLIGQTALTDRTEALNLAKDFGISESSVGAYANGSTSTASYDKKPNEPVINKLRDRITKKARVRMLMAMNHITDAKLGLAKPRDLAGIAKDMSAIVRNMEPEVTNPNPEASKPAFMVYAPQIRDERHYEVIVVKE